MFFKLSLYSLWCCSCSMSVIGEEMKVLQHKVGLVLTKTSFKNSSVCFQHKGNTLSLLSWQQPDGKHETCSCSWRRKNLTGGWNSHDQLSHLWPIRTQRLTERAQSKRWVRTDRKPTFRVPSLHFQVSNRNPPNIQTQVRRPCWAGIMLGPSEPSAPPVGPLTCLRSSSASADSSRLLLRLNDSVKISPADCQPVLIQNQLPGLRVTQQNSRAESHKVEAKFLPEAK